MSHAQQTLGQVCSCIDARAPAVDCRGLRQLPCSWLLTPAWEPRRQQRSYASSWTPASITALYQWLGRKRKIHQPSCCGRGLPRSPSGLLSCCMGEWSGRGSRGKLIYLSRAGQSKPHGALCSQTTPRAATSQFKARLGMWRAG